MSTHDKATAKRILTPLRAAAKETSVKTGLMIKIKMDFKYDKPFTLYVEDCEVSLYYYEIPGALADLEQDDDELIARADAIGKAHDEDVQIHVEENGAGYHLHFNGLDSPHFDTYAEADAGLTVLHLVLDVKQAEHEVAEEVDQLVRQEVAESVKSEPHVPGAAPHACACDDCRTIVRTQDKYDALIDAGLTEQAEAFLDGRTHE